MRAMTRGTDAWRRNRMVRHPLSYGLLALAGMIAGGALLASAAVAKADEGAMAAAPRCGAVVSESCVSDRLATVLDSQTTTTARGGPVTSVTLRLAAAETTRVSLAYDAKPCYVTVGQTVVAEAFRGDVTAIILPGAVRVTTDHNPPSRAAHDFMAAFAFLWALPGVLLLLPSWRRGRVGAVRTTILALLPVGIPSLLERTTNLGVPAWGTWTAVGAGVSCAMLLLRLRRRRATSASWLPAQPDGPA